MIKVLAVLSLAPLESLLKKASDSYYNKDSFLKLTAPDRKYLKSLLGIDPGATVTDKVFDKLWDYLKDKKPNSPALKVGAPIKKQKAKLPFPMYSLDKIKPNTGAVAQWFDAHDPNYVVSDKLDGVSVELDYRDPKNVKAYTRGNGVIGGDISYLIPHLKIPQTLKQKIVVRGEILMSRSKFDSWSDQFENARNMAAGLTNRNDVHPGVKDLSVVVYSQIYPAEKPTKYLPRLKALGFRVVSWEEWVSATDQELSEYLIKRRAKSLYDMDGLVITQDIAAPAKTTGNPSWAIAFKQTSDADIVKAKIKRVVWEASKHGKLVPVIEIEPVKLSGVTIKRATAFHAKFVSDNKLGPGAIVKLTRSGDVIPHVMSVLKPAAKPQMPPQSFGDWEWDTTDTNIYLTDTKQNDLVKAKRLTSFFTTLGVEYLSLGIITKFIDSGLDTVDKIINATPAKMVKLVPGVQDTLAKKLYTNIQDAITEADLATLMDASLLFGQNMGTKRCQLVLKKYPKILSNAKVDKATLIDKLMEVPGFSTTTATQFAVGLPKFVAWLAKHPRITYVIPVISVKKNGKMSGHTVVFTGIRSDEAEAWITKEGGVVGSSVSSSTTLLVAKDPNESSGKILKAKSLGVKIMKFDTFMKQVTK